VLEELEVQAHRQGYKRVYLTTGFRQPEAKELYLRNGYTALFDVSTDPEIYGTLPFEKNIENIRQVDFNSSDTTAKQAVFG
jgi:hypothetical protein